MARLPSGDTTLQPSRVAASRKVFTKSSLQCAIVEARKEREVLVWHGPHPAGRELPAKKSHLICDGVYNAVRTRSTTEAAAIMGARGTHGSRVRLGRRQVPRDPEDVLAGAAAELHEAGTSASQLGLPAEKPHPSYQAIAWAEWSSRCPRPPITREKVKRFHRQGQRLSSSTLPSLAGANCVLQRALKGGAEVAA